MGSAALAALQLRARLYALIRAYFAERHVLEVETPILSAAGNTDPNIESFSTRFSGHVDAGARERWLRTSPEFPLKRLLAAGIGDCYELGRVFRNGEAGGRHNPEFTMLEWYRVGWDHRRLMQETIALIDAALAMAERRAEVVVTSYRQLFLDGLGIDPMHASIDELRAPLAEYNIGPDGLGRDDWLDLLITHKLQPAFPRDRITVIHDYPASQCALAKIRPGEPPLAERFELYYTNNAVTPNEWRLKIGMQKSDSKWADLTYADYQIAIAAARGAKVVDDPALTDDQPAAPGGRKPSRISEKRKNVR